MKRTLLLGTFLIFFAGAAFGQAGGIGLYVDYPTYTQCNYDDTGAALVKVYVVHKYCPGATASQWMVVSGGGFNCTFTGEWHVCAALAMSCGSTMTGITIPYGGCQDASNAYIAEINFFCTGASPACAWLEVVPDPDEPTGEISVVDCNYVKLAAVGSRIYFNDDGTCGACGLPTRDTNWGQIKAMYR